MPNYGVYYKNKIQQTFKTKADADKYVRREKKDPNADGRRFSVRPL
jgi:hypothetical protein